MPAFLAGLFLVAATGFLDDVYRIPPSWKFVGEIAAAATFVSLSGVSIREFGDLFNVGGNRLRTPWDRSLPSSAWSGVMNALNLSDGLDGLAGGISAIVVSFLGLFAYMSANRVPLWILVALAGALFGFLRYNTYPANLFMGDTGSLLLGYTLSAVAVLLVQNDGIRHSPGARHRGRGARPADLRHLAGDGPEDPAWAAPVLAGPHAPAPPLAGTRLPSFGGGADPVPQYAPPSGSRPGCCVPIRTGSNSPR